MCREFGDLDVRDVRLHDGAIFVLLHEATVDEAALLVVEPLGPRHLSAVRHAAIGGAIRARVVHL